MLSPVQTLHTNVLCGDFFDPLQLYKMLENIEPFLFLISDFFRGALSNTGAKLSLTLLYALK